MSDSRTDSGEDSGPESDIPNPTQGDRAPLLPEEEDVVEASPEEAPAASGRDGVKGTGDTEEDHRADS